MDKAVLVLLCGSYALTVYHKVFGDSYMYLLQPCHVNLLLLIFTMVGPKESKVTRMAFNSYLHYIWATIFALSFPDTTENGLYLVIENFWFGKLQSRVYLLRSKERQPQMSGGGEYEEEKMVE